MVWHIVDGEEVAPCRFWLHRGNTSVEMRLVPMDGGGQMAVQGQETGASD